MVIRASLLGASLVAALPVLAAEAAPSRPNASVQAFEIPAGPLAETIARFASAANVVLSFDAEQMRGLRSTGLQGSFSVEAGFARLLAGSGFEAVSRGDRSFVLRRMPSSPVAAVTDSAAAEAAAQLATVTVSGTRDATTEGSEQYTSPAVTIGLGEHSVRDTPNSVSVVTRQRIEDQNMLTIEDAMQYTTGMKVTSYGTNSAAIESRGYTIDRYQVDGISSSARVYENNFGLAMFDRVEVWRGPSGLLQGSGDPGGTINFVRKRAQDTFGFNAKTSIGSWNNYYGEMDVTGPLSADGRLRGRLVSSYQDRHYFTDYAWTREPLLYGTLEYDITPDTTLSLGASVQRNRSRPFFGIAAYENGTFPRVSRSTYIGAAWNNGTQNATRSFAELEHRLEGGGKAKLAAVYIDRRNHGEHAWGNSFIDPATGNIDVIPYYSRGSEREVDIDGRVTLPVTWRGLKQEFLVGASYQRLKSSSIYNEKTWGENGFVQNIFAPDINVPKPIIALDGPSQSMLTQSAVYGQARIKPWAPLTILAGARVAWYESKDLLDSGTGVSTNAKFVPYGGLVYDLTQNFSVYGSYSAIFNPQSDKNFSGQYLPPRKGGQFEFGLKGEHFGGDLQSSLAFYRIEDTNRAIADPDHPDFSIAAGKVRSEGFEAELTGRLLPNWNLTAGYGYNTTKLLVASPEQQGKPFTTTFPKHTVSLWSDYRFREGSLAGLNLGFGMKFRSAIYNEDSGVRWGQGGYTTFDLQAGYQITPKVKASLTVSNLFDKKYIDRPDNWSRQVYFGTPRSVMLTLAYKM